MPSDPKQQVLNKLRDVYEVTREWGYNLHKVNCHSLTYIVESKKQRRGQFWFALDKRIIDQYGNKNLHVLFVCGEADRVVVLPYLILRDFLDEADMAVGNRYHVHIFEQHDKLELALKGEGRFDVTPYLNLFDFTPVVFRSAVITQTRPLLRKQGKTEDEEQVVETPEVEVQADDLISRLVEDAKASDAPEKFEATLKLCLETLGLKCERRGGAGDTDLLIAEPFTSIVDAKTTAKPPLAQVDFDRIHEHQHLHHAEFAVIVATGFSPAVCRGAARQGVALIEVAHLQHLLNLNTVYPFPPHLLRDVFAVRGLVEHKHLAHIEAEVEESKSAAATLLEIARALDSRPREVGEISGRLEHILELANKPPLPRETLARLLDIFSTPPFAIFHRQGKAYVRLLSLEQAVLRLERAAGIMAEAVRQSS